MSPDELPPGPGGKVACPRCGELIYDGDVARVRHYKDHARREREEAKLAQRDRRREAKATLRTVNRLQKETARVLAETGRATASGTLPSAREGG